MNRNELPSIRRLHASRGRLTASNARGWLATLRCGLVAAVISFAPILQAQFSSGSTGNNGVFPPGAPPEGTTGMVIDMRDGTLTFQPNGETTVIPNTPGNGFVDGVLHFVSFFVPDGVTLRFIRNNGNTPIRILSQQLFRVDGTIDVSGDRGGDGGNNGNAGGGQGGPGGFKGGNGQLVSTSARGGTGLGPGGGPGGRTGGLSAAGGGSFATTGARGGGSGNLPTAPAYGQPSCLPLLGGSGGGGGHAFNTSGRVGGGGGGGGGAFYGASDTLVVVDGAIVSNGGAGGAQGGGGGSGGAIRLTSETIRGSGSLSAVGGPGAPAIGGVANPGGAGGLGRIRVEATFQQFAGTVNGFLTTSGPGVVFLPALPTVSIVSVAGVDVPDVIQGGFGGTDIVIAQPGPAEVILAARNVPLGTTIEVSAKPETDGDVVGPVISSGLEGEFGASTSTAELVFPAAGLYFLEARATFEIADP